MKIYDRLDRFFDAPRGGVLAIGNFDGAHRGHQALLRHARMIAKGQGKAFGVLTFEPHPREIFRPDDPPARLTPLPLKAERMAGAEVDFLCAVPFDWDFASRSAANFIDDILKKHLQVSHVVVGRDFRFGQMRTGTPADIETAGLAVTKFEEVKVQDEVISSSAIREALRRGAVHDANRLLGWDWEIWGTVTQGDQRGRKLGYPTANFVLGRTMHPAYGVYAAQVRLESEDVWRAAAVNIGIRPMFEIPEAQVESYIFDFDREIYGQVLKVRPVQRIRSEARFESLEALTRQMKKDCDDIKAILNAMSLRGT